MTDKHVFDHTILREYDIRGVVDDTLNSIDAYAIGRSFGSIVIEKGGKTVAVGRDGRLSSPTLSEALISGLTDSGIDVADIGMGPTPMLYFSVHHLSTDGGIQITGSHNPPNYNGFKMMIGTRSFFGEQIQEVGRRAASGDWQSGSGNCTTIDIQASYVERLLRDYHGKRAIDVVWDAGNGAAGPVMERLAAAIPGRQKLLFEDVDGRFPNHHPDPTEPENLVDLINEVRDGGYEIGIGFDGDGDRIGVVDSDGRIVWGDQLLQFLAADILPRYPGATIIADVKASDTLFDAIERLGGRGMMYKTGHSLIKEKMLETDSPLSGEMSGHIFYKDGFFGHDDALYVAVRTLDILARGQGTLKDFSKTLPDVCNTPEIRIDCREDEKFDIIQKLKRQFRSENKTYSDVDGVRVSTPDGWWLLRASNTQAVLVARAESQTLQGLEKCKSELNNYLSKIGYNYSI